MEAESLAATCALAFAVAREGVEAVPPIDPPAPMRSFLYVAHLPKRAMSVAQRVLEDDEEFRRRVIGRASAESVGAEGYHWLTELAGKEEGESAFSRLADRADISIDSGTAPTAPLGGERTSPIGAPPMGPPEAAIPPMPTPPGGVTGDPFGSLDIPPMPTPPEQAPIAEGFDFPDPPEPPVVPAPPAPAADPSADDLAAGATVAGETGAAGAAPASTTSSEGAASEVADDDSANDGDVANEGATSDAIEGELANLRSLVDRLADERTAVSSSVDDLETEVAERRTESTELSHEIQSLRGDLEAAESARSATEGRVADAEARATNAETERQTLQRTVARLDQERIEIEARLQSSEAALVEARAALAEREAELGRTRTRLDEASSSLDVQRAAAADAESTGAQRVAEVERSFGEQLSAATTELERTRAALSAADSELASVRTELETSRTDLASAGAEVSSLRSELEAARLAAEQARSETERVRSEMQDEVVSVQAETERVRTELQAETERVRAELQAEIAAAEAETERVRAELEADVASARAEREQLGVESAAEIQALRSELESTGAARDQLQESLTATERSVAAGVVRAGELEDELASTSQRLAHAEGIAAQVTFLREELGNAQNEREDLITRLEVSEQARADVERQLSTVSSQWRDLQMELVKLGDHRVAVENELQELLAERQSTMAERAKLFGDLGSQLGRVEAERDLLSAQLARAREHLDGTRAAFAQAREVIATKLDDTEGRLGATDADVADAERSIVRLASEIDQAVEVVDVPVEVPGLETTVTDEAGEILAPAPVEPPTGTGEVASEAAEAEPEALAAVEAVDSVLGVVENPPSDEVIAEPDVEVPTSALLPEPAADQDSSAADSGTVEDAADETTEPAGAAAPVDDVEEAASETLDDAPTGWEAFDNDPGFSATSRVGEADVEVDPTEWLGGDDTEIDTDPGAGDSAELNADDLDTALTLQGLGATDLSGDDTSADDTEAGATADEPAVDLADESDTAEDRPDRRRIDVPAELEGDPAATTRFVVGTDDVVLLIDGDAVAGMGWPAMPTSARRNLLVERLTELAADTGAAPDLVFDGSIGEDDELPVSKSVRVRLTASGIEPSTALAALVDTYPRHWPVAVVTDNPIVGEDARVRGALVLSNAELLDLFLVG